MVYTQYLWLPTSLNRILSETPAPNRNDLERVKGFFKWELSINPFFFSEAKKKSVNFQLTEPHYVKGVRHFSESKFILLQIVPIWRYIWIFFSAHLILSLSFFGLIKYEVV